MKKRMLSAALSVCLLLGLSVIPASAAETDAVQTVRALGIMVGDENGNMALERNVTRAEFAKMLTAASGYKDTVSGSGSGYSLFKDVKSDHWASEYIKTALDAGWMVGYTDGAFRPDNDITLEETCTAVLRLLGYDSANLAGSFPAAQLTKAASLGLRDDLGRAQGERMTRGDCATLFYNLMTAQTSSGQVYAATLGYTLNSAGELDYTALVAKDLKGPYTSADGSLPLPFEPKAVYKDGASDAAAAAYDIYYYNENLKTVYLYDDKVTGVYTAASPGAASPTSVTVGGKSYTIEASQAAYKLSTAGAFAVGDVVTLLLGMDGKVADVVSADAVTAEDMDYTEIVNYGLKGPYTAGAGGQMALPFDPAGASVYRDGSPSAAEQVKQYDIYYYNTSLKVVYVYTDRVTGTYTAATPNTAAPTSVTVAGNVYSMGGSEAKYKLSTLGGCNTGDVVTLLLGMDGTVADVVTGSGVETAYYGVVQTWGKTADDGTVERQVTVACTDGRSHTFVDDTTVEWETGDLVRVDVAGGAVKVSALAARSVSGTVSRGGVKVGDAPLASGARILDTAEDGTAAAVTAQELDGLTLSSSNVRFYALNAAGEITDLILNDATGALWSYGYLLEKTNQGAGLSITERYTLLLDGQTRTVTVNNKSFPVTADNGVAVRQANGEITAMKSLKKVELTAVGATAATAGSQTFSLADDVQVYLGDEDDDFYAVELSDLGAGDYELTGCYDAAQKLIRVIVAVETEG